MRKDGTEVEATRPMTAEDLANKVYWEGGIVSALEYGIRSDEIDDPELAALWRRLETLYDQMRPSLVVTDGLLRAVKLRQGR